MALSARSFTSEPRPPRERWASSARGSFVGYSAGFGAFSGIVRGVCRAIEIVQSHFPGWKFQAPDTIADWALHGTLMVGEPQAVGWLGPDRSCDEPCANSVPDRAEFCVDVRTIPDQNLAILPQRIAATIGDDLKIEPLVELPSIFSNPDDPWVQSVFEIAHEVAGHAPATRTMPNYTDASVFTPAFGAPTVILGPGELEMAHPTDEWCSTDRLDQAVEIYNPILDAWA